ncbi:MAG: hypothetical protein IJ766_05005 [Clostridia bacterium]|nr:hypothetical protein [Clostridia bacterium]
MKEKAKLDAAILRIAQKTICPMEQRADLERHFSDSEDFLDIAVWELKDAMLAAYELGRADAKKK